ncbi:MAG: hypothetical protein AVDCRST_MAG50-3034 [uncultured Acidimicrobiales bacterium]|uniref:ANTAR domain-containing protein n=1 Tax=uncultured Acidimicrobiales bacterium TaxID=310071 RepID=A0A6J4IZT5_9ACTN|nr:MAG: hypothetical protein AVDCRST_MAG50-3034 [uncultured Acidimicrobiales bacterium]
MAANRELVRSVEALAGGDAVLRAKLEALAGLAVKVVPGCDSVSVAIILEDGPADAGGGHGVVVEVDLLQYRFQAGPRFDPGTTCDNPVRVDVVDDRAYRRFAPGALDAGIASVLSLPLRGASGVVGALDLYGKAAGALSDVDQVAESFACCAAEILDESPVLEAAMALFDDVVRRLDDQAVLHRAAGLLAADRGCTIDVALTKLAALALDAGSTLRAAADCVLEAHERRRRSAAG